jgi:hypothetical protein
MKKNRNLEEYLEDLFTRYHKKEFVATDPISVVHGFKGRENKENVKSIIKVEYVCNATQSSPGNRGV